MNQAKKLAQDALKADKALMEFFDPHIERRINYDIELGLMQESDRGYRGDLKFDYEDSTEDEYIFRYEADEGYYGINYVSVSFDSDFVNDPEGAKVKHEEALEAIRQREAEQEDRRIRLEMERKQRELDNLREQLEERGK